MFYIINRYTYLAFKVFDTLEEANSFHEKLSAREKQLYIIVFPPMENKNGKN